MKTITITKVPSSDDFPRVVQRNFPRFPQLYLELLENPAKVKRSCIGKEFIPTTPPRPENGQSSITNTPKIERADDGERRTVVVSQTKSSQRPQSVQPSVSDSRNKLYDDHYNLFNDSRYKSPPTSNKEPLPKEPLPKEPLPTIPEHRKEKIDAKKQSAIKSIQREVARETHIKDRRPPPSLKEIEQRKRLIEDEENEEDKKRDVMWKMDLLRRKHPEKNFPEFTIRMDYKSMKKTYDIIFKQLVVDESANTYRNYLVGGFLICEMVFGRIGFDMDGFTKQQLLTMSSYEKLLLELGEKTYTPAGMERWPVEVRLALAIFFNAVWFIAARVIQKKSKIDILALHNTITGLASTRRSAPTDRSPDLHFIGKAPEEGPRVSASGTRMMKGPSVRDEKDEGFFSSEERSAQKK